MNLATFLSDTLQQDALRSTRMTILVLLTIGVPLSYLLSFLLTHTLATKSKVRTSFLIGSTGVLLLGALSCRMFLFALSPQHDADTLAAILQHQDADSYYTVIPHEDGVEVRTWHQTSGGAYVGNVQLPHIDHTARYHFSQQDWNHIQELANIQK